MENERSRKEKRAMELFFSFFLTSDASCGREFHSV